MKPFGKLLISLISIGLSSQAFSADINRVKKSKWNAVYADDDGTFSVDNTVVLNGKSGYYVTEGGRKGKLSGIKYNYISPKPELKVGVYGKWQLGNQTGNFTFRVSGDGKKFAGQWVGGNNQQGTWTGRWRKWKDDEDEEGPVDSGPQPFEDSEDDYDEDDDEDEEEEEPAPIGDSDYE
jgi:hypothetical protein